MSLVGLINLIFHKNLVPRKARRKICPRQNHIASDSAVKISRPHLWENENQQPLLTSSSDIESHFTEPDSMEDDQLKGLRVDPRIISDATIGLSDGLTVPFALTSGLSALGNTEVVIYGGLAELIAGAISMGLGGYLGAKSEALVMLKSNHISLLTVRSASYHAMREETKNLLTADPETIIRDITNIFRPYDIPKESIEDITKHLTSSPRLVDFFMQFKHCQEEPAASRAFISAITIALGYFLGGMLPLFPYFFVDQVRKGLFISIVFMVITLFSFGYVKTGIIEGWKGKRKIQSCCYGGSQMVVVGGAAAAAAMGIIKLFERGNT